MNTGLVLAFLIYALAFLAAPACAVASASIPAPMPKMASTPEGLAPSDWSSIRAAYEAHRHAVVADETTPGHYRARNPGQRWITTFDGRGFYKTPNAGLDGSSWTWGLDLVSYGRGEKQQTITGIACVQTKGTRVEYAWNHALTEWYINDQSGFEHGYTLRDRPEGANGPDGMLHFTIGVRGELVPRVSENGRDVAFTNAADGSTTLTYNNLIVFDADGTHLAASFAATTTPTGAHALRLTIDDTSARYPLTIDPIAQQAYLKASNTDPNDNFGHSVAISGDTVVVGAFGESSSAMGINGDQLNNDAGSSGAAYVFIRTGSGWTQQSYLKASNAEVVDRFGYAVAISGDTIVVGAWFEDSNATGVNGNQSNNSAPESGAAYVFVRPPGGTTWTQQAYLKASNTGANDLFGHSVAISGDTVVVGAYGEDSIATGVNGSQTNNSSPASGAAYVFVRPPGGTTWTQQAYLKASNTGGGDSFGRSVAVSGDTIVIGASQEDSNATGVNGNEFSDLGTDAGAAYVFVRSGTVWSQQAYLKASNTEALDAFGISVSISGNTAVVGAFAEASNATGVNGNGANNSAQNAGAAYVFVRAPGGGTWTQQAYLKASNTNGSDEFGFSVAIAGNTIVVGAEGEDSNSTGVNGSQSNNSATDSGAAYVFTRATGGTTWTQQSYLKASNTGADDRFGRSVAVSGDTVVVGSWNEDSNSSGPNGNQANNDAVNSGATYVFSTPQPVPTPTNPLASPAIVCSANPSVLVVANPGAGIVIDWFTGSCGGTLIGTGNPFNVTPAASTTYFARARRTSDGESSVGCVSVTVGVLDPSDPACNVCPACAADYDEDGGVTGGDLAAFFADYEAGANCADVDEDGGITGGDLGFFFTVFEAGGC